MIGCPCNQFGFQENVKGEEIYSSLANVRPGGGFVPAFPLTQKLDVNGADSHPLWLWLRMALPERSDTGFAKEAAEPMGVQKSGLKIVWSPSNPTDVVWNFEKFLFDSDGYPVKRLSQKFETIALADEISKLIGA